MSKENLPKIPSVDIIVFGIKLSQLTTEIEMYARTYPPSYLIIQEKVLRPLYEASIGFKEIYMERKKEEKSE